MAAEKYGDVISFTFGSKPYVAMVLLNSIDLTNLIVSDEGTSLGPDFDQGVLVLGLTVSPVDQTTYHQQGRTATRLRTDGWDDGCWEIVE